MSCQFVPKVGDDIIQQQKCALLPSNLFHDSSSFCITFLDSHIWLTDVSSSFVNVVDDGEFDDLDLFILDVPSDQDQSVMDKICAAQVLDIFVLNTKKNLQPFMSVVDRVLLVHGCIYVPSSCCLDVLRLCHDSPVSGHPGNSKTFYLVSRSFWWPQMHHSINSYVASCEVCCHTTTSHQVPTGLLKPLKIPKCPWTSVSMDFIVRLPLSNGSNVILVITDRFSKMVHFIVCHETCNATILAEIYVVNVFCLHGIPVDIISDHGSVFVAQFWKEFTCLLGIKNNYSTAFHPQMDGQTECVNQVLEQYLCCYLDYDQSNQLSLLPLTEFAFNNSVHSSMKMSLFNIC